MPPSQMCICERASWKLVSKTAGGSHHVLEAPGILRRGELPISHPLVQYTRLPPKVEPARRLETSALSYAPAAISSVSIRIVVYHLITYLSAQPFCLLVRGVVDGTHPDL